MTLAEEQLKGLVIEIRNNSKAYKANKYAWDKAIKDAGYKIVFPKTTVCEVYVDDDEKGIIRRWHHGTDKDETGQQCWSDSHEFKYEAAAERRFEIELVKA